jgi:hemerythrin-like metal-binding protein
LELAPNLPSLEGDPAQIQQVIMNLVLNASEAVDHEGGVITIRTGQMDLTQASIDQEYKGQALSPGPKLLLEVADNGPGMSAEVLERIFDPFFTTKFTGRGLGLAAVQGILRSHQGGIQVHSREGEGTCFSLLFPASAVPLAAVAAPAPALEREADIRGAGTVLVVDDEDALRSVAATALRCQGYETLEARDGLEALQVYEANQAQIQLILMDLTMPRMDGDEAYRELRRASAMVPIILASGFGQAEALLRFRGRGLAAFLPKPYRIQDLLQAVRTALEGQDSRTSLHGFHPGERLSWSREFESGHPLIDEQHHGLVSAFNQLLALVERDAGPAEWGPALARLIDATIAHFGVEEGLMAAADYGNAKAHQAVHARLNSQIQDLARKLRAGEVSFTPAVVNYMEDWLVCHLQFEDRHLARHLKTGGH